MHSVEVSYHIFKLAQIYPLLFFTPFFIKIILLLKDNLLAPSSLGHLIMSKVLDVLPTMTCHENGKWCNLGPIHMESQVLSHVGHLRLMRAISTIKSIKVGTNHFTWDPSPCGFLKYYKACLLCTQKLQLERFVVAHTTIQQGP